MERTNERTNARRRRRREEDRSAPIGLALDLAGRYQSKYPRFCYGLFPYSLRCCWNIKSLFATTKQEEEGNTKETIFIDYR